MAFNLNIARNARFTRHLTGWRALPATARPTLWDWANHKGAYHMHDDMTLDDAMEIVARRRDRHIRRAQMAAWLKFALVSCAFAALMILR